MSERLAHQEYGNDSLVYHPQIRITHLLRKTDVINILTPQEKSVKFLEILNVFSETARPSA